jgi:starch-binding outer membrane protein SusE/F
MKTINLNIQALKKGHLLVTLVLAVLCASLFISCEDYEDAYSPTMADKPVLKTNFSSIELNQKQENTTAVALTWTAGSNEGTNSAINYTLQIDKKGNDFSSPYTIDAGKGSYSKNLSVAELNDLLRNTFLVVDGSADLEMRIIAKALDASVDADSSNVVSVSATPYEPKDVPANLYLIGDATPNGWDNANPTMMTKSGNDPSVFTFQGQLSAGEFKLLTTPGQWLPSYQRGADEHTMLYRTDFGQPDEKWAIAEAGLHKITVDVIEMTIDIVALEASPFNELWIVGSAVPKGWDLDNAEMMSQDPADPFVFSYNEILTAGEFKIATAKNWGAPFYRPVDDDQPITATAVQLSAGDPDTKWDITEPGPYKITINLRDNTIAIKPYTPYENLWMVGDATPAGWNIDAPVLMTRESDYIFTWTGQLNAGEFKFPISTGNWGTGFFMPYNADEAITATTMTFRPTGSPDTKWRVQPGEKGIYKITLDQLHHTISIEKQ